MAHRAVTRTCSVDGCNKPHEARGLCRSHYRKQPDRATYEHSSRVGYLRDYIRSSRGRYVALKRAAKDKALGFDITEAEHAALHEQPCVYCGGALEPTGHGLDRKDNSKGYLKSNVVPCCIACNRIKNVHLTHDEMLVAMRAVLAFRRG